MAVTYGFYDSLNHDRLYNAQQMSAIFDGIINDGVFMSVGNQFHTVAGTGMQVIVKSGRAWFDSTWTLNDAEYPLSIDAADVLLTRIDAVVLEVNSEVATRANTIKVVKGTPASTPAKPTLTNTATIHQHALAYVTVAKNITAITNSMIEIVVGKTETPYVTAILQTTDITDLFNQWEDYFQTWFDTVRGTLDGDVALNLQNQITTLRRDTLKSTTPPIIGLPSSVTPDDMFQALAKTGDLHVWRKTVTTAQEIPAGYTLESVSNFVIATRDASYAYGNINLSASTTISVDDNGGILLTNPTSLTSISIKSTSSATTLNNNCRGKFCLFTSNETYPVDTVAEGVYYIPSTATFTVGKFGSNNIVAVDTAQKVVAYPLTPAGTTTTYPVSTNPNAYQEGSDAKPARYVLGSKTETWAISSSNSTATAIATLASSVSVGNDGTVSLVSPNTNTTVAIETNSQYVSVARDHLRGNFLQRSDGTIWYIPSDANVTFTASGVSEYGAPYHYCFVAEMQPVTGYAAIPAGTTIEYLGKLGDKAREQVVSYVGTGTYGSDHPNSLTFDFVPKVVMFLRGYKKGFTQYHSLFSNYDTDMSVIVTADLSENFTSYNGFGYYNEAYAKKDTTGRVISWYNIRSALNQANENGITYYFLAIS